MMRTTRIMRGLTAADEMKITRTKETITAKRGRTLFFATAMPSGFRKSAICTCGSAAQTSITILLRPKGRGDSRWSKTPVGKGEPPGNREHGKRGEKKIKFYRE